MDEIKIYKKYLRIDKKEELTREVFFKRLARVLVIGISLVILYLLLFKSPLTQIDTVSIKAVSADSQLTDQEAVLLQENVLKVVSGKNLFLTKIEEVEEVAYKSSPYVQKVTVHKSFPQTLTIKASRRHGVMLVATNSGCVLLDRFGFTLEYEKKELEEDASIEKIQKSCAEFLSRFSLPVLYVKALKAEFKPGNESTFYDASKFIQLIDILNASNYQPLQISWDKDTYLVTTSDKHQLIFSALQDFELQLKRFIVVADQIASNEMEFVSLDLRYERPVLRRK